jgi:hypothetical protein
MATEATLSNAKLGTVLDTFGGKSLKRIVTVGAAIFGCGLTTAIFIRLFRPDYFGVATFVLGLGVVLALAYVRTNWEAAYAKVEVCEGGVRLHSKSDPTRSVPGIVELTWDRIRKVEVGSIGRGRGWREHVVIRTIDGENVEFPYGFWAAVGTSRFAAIMDRFVADVEVDVKFT